MSTYDASNFDDATFEAGRSANQRALPADRSLRAQVVWGGGGFLLGVIVWHFIGFWSFISTIVFRGPDPGPDPGAAPVSVSVAAARPAIAPAKRSQTVSGTAPAHVTVAASASDCSALVLDRSTGTTSLAACAGIQQPMRMVQFTQRADRHVPGQPADSAWRVVVDADGDGPVTGRTVAETSIDATIDPRLGQRAVQLD